MRNKCGCLTAWFMGRKEAFGRWDAAFHVSFSEIVGADDDGRSILTRIAPHEYVRLIGKIRTEPRKDRAAAGFVHLEIILQRIWRSGVIRRHGGAEFIFVHLHRGGMPALRLISLPVEKVHLSSCAVGI